MRVYCSFAYDVDQTPPKRELKVSDPQVRDQTLLQLQLAPSSVLHLKFEDDTLNRMWYIPSHLMALQIAANRYHRPRSSRLVCTGES